MGNVQMQILGLCLRVCSSDVYVWFVPQLRRVTLVGLVGSCARKITGAPWLFASGVLFRCVFLGMRVQRSHVWAHRRKVFNPLVASLNQGWNEIPAASGVCVVRHSIVVHNLAMVVDADVCHSEAPLTYAGIFVACICVACCWADPRSP